MDSKPFLLFSFMSNPLSPFSNIRFCPKCGVDSIERDVYRNEHVGEMNSDGMTRADGRPEYLCKLCGFAFAIGESLRGRHAALYHKELRQLRPPKV